MYLRGDFCALTDPPLKLIVPFRSATPLLRTRPPPPRSVRRALSAQRLPKCRSLNPGIRRVRSASPSSAVHAAAAARPRPRWCTKVAGIPKHDASTSVSAFPQRCRYPAFTSSPFSDPLYLNDAAAWRDPGESGGAMRERPVMRQRRERERERRGGAKGRVTDYLRVGGEWEEGGGETEGGSFRPHGFAVTLFRCAALRPGTPVAVPSYLDDARPRAVAGAGRCDVRAVGARGTTCACACGGLVVRRGGRRCSCASCSRMQARKGTAESGQARRERRRRVLVPNERGTAPEGRRPCIAFEAREGPVMWWQVCASDERACCAAWTRTRTAREPARSGCAFGGIHRCPGGRFYPRAPSLMQNQSDGPGGPSLAVFIHWIRAISLAILAHFSTSSQQSPHRHGDVTHLSSAPSKDTPSSGPSGTPSAGPPAPAHGELGRVFRMMHTAGRGRRLYARPHIFEFRLRNTSGILRVRLRCSWRRTATSEM
ncbi:hypothetical protein C8R47DRAFT_392891 [Mycena vitilis]|nr:hypothetical protein C8R47DRAFT_392891 [Mycena vitilis]